MNFLKKKNDAQNGSNKYEVIIRPVSKLGYFNISEIVRYRHLLWSMIWKDIRIDYDQMVFGIFWATALPLFMLAIFTLFRNFSGAQMYVNISYPLYLYSGLILWFHFREATMSTARSVSRDAGMIKKIYYPRIITPIAPAISRLYTLGIATIPLVCMMFWYGVFPGWCIFLLPFVLIQCTILVMGIGMIFACLSVIKEDFNRFLTICLYLGLFVSPVIFAPEMIPAKGRIIYYMNPMAGTLLAFRACLFKNFPFPFWQFIYSVSISIILVLIGITMYKKTEIYLADKI